MSDKDSKWWEFYGVRYAQGTVVGAVMVFFLFSQSNAMKKILFVPADPKDFGVPHLILLAVYGLAYCYIASAPILIMHAARGLLFEAPGPDKWQKRVIRFASVFVPALAATGLYYWQYDAAPKNVIGATSAFVFVLLISLQFRLLYEIFVASWVQTKEYYEEIIKKRADQNNAGYVESYKHIREHGNSFLIVLFQFLLAIPIFIFVSQPEISPENSIRHLAIIILAWVVPASAIWAFGNKLENNIKTFP